MDYDAVRAEAREWLVAHWDPDATVRDWWALLAGSGWGFPSWPEDRFGRGLPAAPAEAVREAFDGTGVLGPPSSLGQLLGAPTLFAHATPEQVEEFVPDLAFGREAWCQLFSEPEAGSDLASLRTRAVRDGDEWVVTGQKVWTSKARQADRAMLLARTDPDRSKHRGLTYFVIDMDQPGIEVRPLHQMNGRHEFNEVFLTEARVPHDRIVGAENGGWPVAVTTLAVERMMHVARTVDPGPAGGWLDRPAGAALGRRAGGVEEGWGTAPAAPVVLDLARTATAAARRQRTAGLLVTEEVQRLTAARELQAVRTGAEGVSGSVHKLLRSGMARAGREAGLHVLGADGLLTGPDTPAGGVLQSLAVSCPGTSLAGGTDEIQRNIIGERVLGLPRDPRPEREQG